MGTQIHDRDSPVDSIALGLALGVAWGLAVGLIGLGSKVGWGDRWRHLLADVYVGFEPGSGQASVGVAWAVVDGFLGGVVVGGLYNTFARARQSTNSSTVSQSADGVSTTRSAAERSGPSWASIS